MISVKNQPKDGIELSDKKQSVRFTEGKVVFNDLTIDAPGEYEGGGVEIIFSAQAVLVVWERVQLALITKLEKPSVFEKNNFTPADVLIVSSEISELEGKAFNELLEAYDPKLVIVTDKTTLDGKLKEALKFTISPQVKITLASLPTEGRECVSLGNGPVGDTAAVSVEPEEETVPEPAETPATEIG